MNKLVRGEVIGQALYNLRQRGVVYSVPMDQLIMEQLPVIPPLLDDDDAIAWAERTILQHWPKERDLEILRKSLIDTALTNLRKKGKKYEIRTVEAMQNNFPPVPELMSYHQLMEWAEKVIERDWKSVPTGVVYDERAKVIDFAVSELGESGVIITMDLHEALYRSVPPIDPEKPFDERVKSAKDSIMERIRSNGFHQMKQLLVDQVVHLLGSRGYHISLERRNEILGYAPEFNEHKPFVDQVRILWDIVISKWKTDRDNELIEQVNKTFLPEYALTESEVNSIIAHRDAIEANTSPHPYNGEKGLDYSYYATWILDRRETDSVNFITGVNEWLTANMRFVMTDHEIKQMLKYREEFESTGQNVWDGSRDQHYGKWIIKRREFHSVGEPKFMTHDQTNVENFNQRVVRLVEEKLRKSRMEMLMYSRIAELINIHHQSSEMTEEQVANRIVWHIKTRVGTKDDEYRTATVRVVEGQEQVASMDFGSKYPPEHMRVGLKTLTSFCGADQVYIINGVVVGEVQGITWTQKLRKPFADGYAVQGYVDFTVFDREPIRDLIQRERTTMCIFFGNEYGQKGLQRFVNPEFTHLEASVSVDDIVQTKRYHFHADDVTLLQHDGPLTMDNGELNPVFDR